MMDVPVWLYFVFAGIIFSAIMTIKATKEEEQVDNQFIEKEGEVYIKRMEEEKTKRKKQVAN